MWWGNSFLRTKSIIHKALIPAIFLVTGTVCPDSAAEAPILILAGPGGYGLYTGEILKAEGLNEFIIESPSDRTLTSGHLARFDVVVLAEATLTGGQVQMLTRFVLGGGNLLAFRPDKQLAPLFGLLDARESIADGYVRIDNRSMSGKGLLGDALQFHGEADLYDLRDAANIATLHQDEGGAGGKPAVTWKNYGKGRAVAFTYNLPRSIVLTRQGNHRFAGQEKDGIKGIRAADMFTDGWVNPSKNALNQADEQMRLLSRLIEQLASSNKPLPHLWYFPYENRSLLMLTSDGEDSAEEDFDAQLADVKSKGANMTLYLKGTYIPGSKVRRWISEGFEISGHVDDTLEATDPTYNSMSSRVGSTVDAFMNLYGLEMRTVRNHWIVWCGRNADGSPEFAAQAVLEAKHGIRFDCNLYHYDRESNQGDFLGPVGNFTGSGLPMKFAASDGGVLDIYGLVTQLPDEQWGRGSLYENSKRLLDRSLDDEIYTFILANLHTDRWRSWSRPEGIRMMDYANSRGVPMWTVRRTLEFLQTRDSASFKNITWAGNRLSFLLNAPGSETGLTILVPASHAGCTISGITKNGIVQKYLLRTIKGSECALVTTGSGVHQVVVSYTGGGIRRSGS